MSNSWTYVTINQNPCTLSKSGFGKKMIFNTSLISLNPIIFPFCTYYFDHKEFVLTSISKTIYKQNHEFETLLCQVSIVKSCEKQLKRKDDRIQRLQLENQQFFSVRATHILKSRICEVHCHHVCIKKAITGFKVYLHKAYHFAHIFQSFCLGTKEKHCYGSNITGLQEGLKIWVCES